MPMDAWREGDRFVIEFDLPGVNADSIDLLKASGGWSIGVDSGDWGVGPVWHAGGSFPIASIELFDSTFGMNFEERTFGFQANEHALI